MEKTLIKTSTLETLAEEYRNLTDSKDAIDARLKDIREIAKTQMGDATSVKTEAGIWSKYLTTKYGWSLQSLRRAFGSRYTSFVKSDDKLVKEVMESGEDKSRSAMLRKSAMTAVSETVKLV